MDSKALAKSKRAHSLHHSKKQTHSSQKSKAKATPSGVTDGAGSGNKVAGKQAREKARQSGLPSNWDRYEDEFDSGSEGPSGDSTNKASDVIFPKSKGADYRHLIAEAQSQGQSDSYLDIFPSLDDILPGRFKFGVESMLSARGEGILSWIGDDNFLVEDEATVNAEANFLSLNLNALAEQLEKVDISERLFIEADLLPPELSGHRTRAISSQESDRMQAVEMEVTSRVSEDLVNLLEENKVANQSCEVMASGSTMNGHLEPILINQGLDIINQTEDDISSTHDSRTMESPAECSASTIADPKKKTLTFEATTAEAELDMLLDSFKETQLVSSSGFTSAALPLSENVAPRPLPQLTGNTMSSSKPVSTAVKLDDLLDDLLEETSNLSNQNNSYHAVKVTPLPKEIQSSQSQSVTKSKVLDEFDSWLDTL